LVILKVSVKCRRESYCSTRILSKVQRRLDEFQFHQQKPLVVPARKIGVYIDGLRIDTSNNPAGNINPLSTRFHTDRISTVFFLYR
jgi:hypothetical protein